MNSPPYVRHQLLLPQKEPLLPSFPGNPSGPAGWSTPGSCKVCFFPESWYTREPESALLQWSLCCPRSNGAPAGKPYWPSKPNALGAHLPSARTLDGEPDMGLRAFTPVGELLQYNCSSVSGSPTCGVWDGIISQVPPS